MERPLDPADAGWLCHDEAAATALADLAQTSTPGPSLLARLRKSYSATRAGLLLEQAELRRRARRKFDRADRMFFTRVGLEQATDQWVAAYKASRFRGEVADLCCGVGGDLIAFAARGKATGVDLCPATAIFARANVSASEALATVEAREATAECVRDADAWHADPDRRHGGKRSVHTDNHSPDTAALDALVDACPNAAIKLAPAAATPERWQAEREHEWISRQGECRQLVVWSGSLATCHGRRRATAVLAGGATASFTGETSLRVETAPAEGPYLYEPDAAVLAAGLDNALADHHGLARLTPAAAYYTGETVVDDPLLAAFRVIDRLPLRAKVVSKYLRERGVGVVEIKHRGVELAPESFRRSLRLAGDERATLIATTIGRKGVVFVAERVVQPAG